MAGINCIIVEDKPADTELLTYFIKQEPALNLLRSFNNPLEAFSFIGTGQPPLLFMDIDMPVMNGIDLFKTLTYSPVCIFVTAHSEYALDSYEVHAFDFIVKPVTESRFKLCVQRLKEYLGLRSRADLYDAAFDTQVIQIKEGTVTYRVLLSDILYLEALKDYTKVVTKSRKYITLSKLKHFMDKLPAEDFMRIHRSYAVAKDKVEKFDREEVVVNTEKLPIGKTYKRDVMKGYSD